MCVKDKTSKIGCSERKVTIVIKADFGITFFDLSITKPIQILLTMELTMTPASRCDQLRLGEF